MPTSQRLYYEDSFLNTFTASVTQLRDFAATGGSALWQVELDRTAFYPTSGGQPFDTGTLLLTAPGASPRQIAVQQVEEDEAGAVWHVIGEPLAPGTVVEGRIDWDRRFDHMQQHTGQHLLSAVFFRELQMPTVSFHLGEFASTIDLAGSQPSAQSLEQVERIANRVIFEDRPVTVSYAQREEAEAMQAAGDLRKLPAREGAIRLIDIADCDRNACGGTHVRSTGQIGALLLRGIEKVSRGVRVEFVCGSRAVRSARSDAALLTETRTLLSTGAPELPETVSRLLAQSKAAARERQKLREELALLHAAALAAEEPIENGLRLLVRDWTDRDFDYVKMLASRTAAAAPATAVVFSAREGDAARVVVARSSDLDFNCGKILREALAQMGLRGGGSADLAQGEVPIGAKPTLFAAVTEAIRGAGEQTDRP